MAEDFTLAKLAVDCVAGVQYPRAKLSFGVDGAATAVSALNPLPVAIISGGGGSSSGGLTDTELRASPLAVTGAFYPATQPVSGTVGISGTVAVSGSFYPATQPVSIASMPSTPVTGTFWPATQPVSGTVAISGSVAVTGPLTDTQLRATAISVTFTNSTLAVTGPLTDAQLRAAAVPVSIASMPSTPVTGTFWQATQPVSIAATVNVSGPLTDTQLRASPVPVTGSLSVGSAEVNATARGRANTFRTPGRAGTTGQKLFALHNATGSAKIVHINQLTVDLACTVIKAVTVLPPIIRVHRFTAIPTNGTALGKVSKDSGLSSNNSVTAWGDASADGTLSASALTVTIPAGSLLTQEYAPRLITAAGYEMFDRTELLEGKDIVLRALEGIVVFLDYTLATQNPATDMWIVGCDWYEI